MDELELIRQELLKILDKNTYISARDKLYYISLLLPEEGEEDTNKQRAVN